MKYLTLIIAALLFANTSYAQTVISNQDANQYYQSCLTKTDPRITKPTQDIFCQCTASFMKKNMSVEDVQAMAKQDQTGRNALNKMLTQVYAPCMEFPVRDWVYQKCTQDAFQAGKQICSCMSDNMAKYVRERASQDLPTILANNPNLTDPMEAIVNSQSYEQAEKRIVLGCLQGEYK